MSVILLPAIWLIVIIVGLPQLSETIYTPSLPSIASSLHTTPSMVEYTLTIYLLGFAIGTLIWGNASDKWGRKPCVIVGLIIFLLGCVGCYFAFSINHLLISRFIQALGGSVGSVLGQAICRDVFQGPALGKIYAVVGGALAIFPAIGPIIGGVIAENFGWFNIFLFLIVVTLALLVIIIYWLPETHHPENRATVSIINVVLSLAKNKKVIGFGILVGGCNGISFSYFAEGSFYLIKLLGLSPSQYGMSFLLLAGSTFSGGLLSKKLHSTQTPYQIITKGVIIILIASALFSGAAYYSSFINPLSKASMIGVTIGMQMMLMFGICLVTSNALALALTDYKWCIGTASSLFGFFYYVLISLFTLIMSYLHNGTLLPMPFYFLSISLLMLLVSNLLIGDK